MPLLDLSDVTMRFGGLVAVNGLNLKIESGQLYGLIGPNGAGKTTFFNMITGYHTPTAGEIVFDGKSITTRSGNKVRSMKPHEVTGLGIGRTFQNIRLFGTMSALDNVRIGLNIHLKSHWWDSVLRTPGMLREEQGSIVEAMGLLKLVDLESQAETWARNLPYGDQRRLEIARALATRPKLLLLDEPTAGMNTSETREMTDFIRKLRSELSLTVLLIEHDMRVVMGISDRVTVLDHGEVIAEGGTARGVGGARRRGPPREARCSGPWPPPHGRDEPPRRPACRLRRRPFRHRSPGPAPQRRRAPRQA